MRSKGTLDLPVLVYVLKTLNRRRGMRIGRVLLTGAAVVSDFKWNLRHVERGSDEYKASLKEINLRVANRLLDLCLSNKGIFTKFGQHLASLNHVLPKEYTETLTPLQDKALPEAFDGIRAVIETELNGEIHEHFREFDEKPIAAASLAQVHRAVTKEGREVAVKVQYPELSDQMDDDLWVMEQAMYTLEYFFPEFEMSWILPEFETAVGQELDFVNEKHNSQRLARCFAHDKHVYIPQVEEKYSSKRVLTMEFIDGIKITNQMEIKRQGLDPRKIAHILSQAFGHMIFCEGFLHCDPHPGNVFVRKVEGKEQIVLLDHGLYRELDEKFRQTFCRLFTSILMRDAEQLTICGTELGVGPYAKFFPLIFTGRTMSNTAKYDTPMTLSERKKLRQDLKQFNITDIGEFMKVLPRDMLFVFRISNLVRSLNKELGGSKRSRFWIMGKHAIEGSTIRDESKTSLKSWVRYYFQFYKLTVRLWLVDYVFLFLSNLQ